MLHYERSIKIIGKTFYPTETSSSLPKKDLESFLDQSSTHLERVQSTPRSRWSRREEGDSSDPYRRLSRQTAMIQPRFQAWGGNPLNRRERTKREPATGWEKTRQFLHPVVINANGGMRKKQRIPAAGELFPSFETRSWGYHWKLGCSIKELIVEQSFEKFRKDFWRILKK